MPQSLRDIFKNSKNHALLGGVNDVEKLTE